MSVICKKCKRVSNINSEHICSKPLTIEQVHKQTVKFVKAVEEAHKNAGNSKLVFG